MRRLFSALAAACLLSSPALTGPAHAEGKSIIVLDASGSMWGQIEGRAKLEIAREALAEVLSSMPAETEMGLMAYGHRSKGDCSDIELVVPPAAGTAGAISKAANEMKFLGKTPLSAAVRLAAEDLRYTEEKANVILITDGIETCEADPCALGNELEQSGIDFTAHVVGFGLTKEEGQAVACLAENTGGKYIEAGDAGSLVDALKTTVVMAPEPAPEPEPAPQPAEVEYNLVPSAVFAVGGDPVGNDYGPSFFVHLINQDGTDGERVDTQYIDPRFKLEPGKYRIRVTLGEAVGVEDVEVSADAVSKPVININAGRLVIHPKVDATATDSENAAVQLTLPDGTTTTYYGTTKTVFPAGDVPVRVKIGQAVAEQVLTLPASQTLEVDIVAAAGLAAIEAYYTPEMMVEGSSHGVQILPPKADLNGDRKVVDYGYGAGQQFTLPPGDYVARVTLEMAEVEQPFTVKGNERTDVKVVLNAGVLAIKAPGAGKIEVYEPKADLNGNRKVLDYEYAEEMNTTGPAGDYHIIIDRDGEKIDMQATIKAGERTEVSLP